MKTTKIFVSLFLVLCLAAPVSAQSHQFMEFARGYRPSSGPEAAPPPAPTVAQVFQTGTVPISLQDVIAMMLDHNLDIRTNRFSPRSSALQTLISYGALVPVLSFSSSVGRDSSVSSSQVQGANTLSSLSHQFSVGYSQQLPWGTDITVNASMNRSSSNSITNTFNPSYRGNIRYSVGQPLLRGRGRMINTRQIIVGKNNERLSEIQFETQMINLLVTAQRTYWDLVFAAEDLKVKQRSLELARQTLTENQMKVEIGTLAPIEVKQTESDVANRNQQLIQSRGALVQTEDQIKRLVSEETDPSLFLVRLTTMDSPRRPGDVTIPSLEEAVRIAMENRPELRQAAIELENQDITVDVTRNQKLPILDVTATFNQNGTGGTRTIRSANFGGQIIEVIPGGVWSALGQIFSYDFRGYSVGFNFQMPLSNKAAEAEYSRAVNERRLSESRLDVTRQQIALEVRNALTQIEQAQASIETAQIAKELAQDRLEAEQTKFNLGTSTLRFVLEEQRNLAQAETTELQSVITFTKAVVDLDRAMGLTLMKNNVRIDEALAPTAIASRSLTDRVQAGN